MENNLKYIVYCTTNTINNKIYIGVHMTNPNIFDGYIGNGIYINNKYTYERSKTKFQYAVTQIGVKNFKRNTLAIFNTAEEAYYLEECIVNNEFLQRDDVYNMALGGTNGAYLLTCKKVYQYNQLGKFLKEYNSISEASRDINRSLIGIQRAIKDKCKCKNYFWTEIYYTKLDLSKMKQYDGVTKIPVFQYSNKGEYECCYESINDAGRVLKKDSTNIGNSIKLGTLCYNKYFSTEFSTTFSIANNNRIKSTIIYQYDLDGNYITSYKSMAEAKKILGIKSDIYKAIRLGRLSGNFQWSFEKLDKMPKIIPKSGRKRKVGKYSKDNILIKEYQSKAECERENGRGASHVLDGRDTYHKGFIYKYLS